MTRPGTLRQKEKVRLSSQVDPLDGEGRKVEFRDYAPWMGCKTRMRLEIFIWVVQYSVHTIYSSLLVMCLYSCIEYSYNI